jgi:GNAT superfamily N-acetyltransferase
VAAELHVRAGASADTERILHLLTLSLGEGDTPRERAYWTWKHDANPFGRSPVLLAEADGELIGLRVFMRWTWRAGCRRYRAVRAVDTATHPAWWGKGIFSKLTLDLIQRVADERLHFVFNTPNDRSRPGYLKMGWTAVGRTDLWIRPLRPLRMARMIAAPASTGRPEIGAFAGADYFESAESLCRQDGLAYLLNDADEPSTSPRLRTARTVDYLRWRYACVPGLRYHTLFEVDGRDGAAIVFRYRHRGRSVELRLCELIVGSTRASVRIARQLLARLARESGADFLSAMSAPATSERQALVRSFFVPAPRLGPTLTVRPLNSGGNGIRPLERAGWRLSIGDLELF